MNEIQDCLKKHCATFVIINQNTTDLVTRKFYICYTTTQYVNDFILPTTGTAMQQYVQWYKYIKPVSQKSQTRHVHRIDYLRPLARNSDI